MEGGQETLNPEASPFDPNSRDTSTPLPQRGRFMEQGEASRDAENTPSQDQATPIRRTSTRQRLPPERLRYGKRGSPTF